MYRVLVIDDEESILNLISVMLSRAFKEIEILTCSKATEGLEVACQKKPDLIILDCILQDKSGLEVCSILKNNPRTAMIPILMISGDSRVKDIFKVSFKQRAESYLYKPFTFDSLISQVKLLLYISEAQRRLIAEKESLEQDIIARNKELENAKNILQNKVKELENIIELQTKELVRADRLANLGVMAAGIAHEINNPTTFIASNLQTFKMFWRYIEEILKNFLSIETDKERKEKINYILTEMPPLIVGMENGARRISEIVKGMKSYAVGGTVDKGRVVDIEETIDSALQLVWNQIKHDITLVKEIDKNLPKVLGSETSLCQVFVNLILNAAHAMKEYRGEGKLTIRASASNGMITIYFIDDGPGIKPEHLQTLFNPFFTTRRDKGGTGLGLFISHGIIKGHNGTINVESDVGKGATFIIKLPAIDKDQTLVATVEQEGTATINPETFTTTQTTQKI